MGDIAIRVENLSKRYRIGERVPYRTLRDTLADAVSFPFRTLFKSKRGLPNPSYVWALKDVSFEVKQGEVLGIIGRNGAGKTTLLKILSRITEPTEGYAEIHGRVGSLLEVGTGFHPELTGRENIYLNGAILGMKKKEIDRKFDEIVAFAEVEKFIDTPVKYYSSGMFVRLAFAVAAHLEPEILLVDEVLAVGDYDYQRKCINKIQQLAGEERAILFVSHNMSTVNLVAKRAIFLDLGRIRKDGRAAEVIAAYLDHLNEQRAVSMSIMGRSTPIDASDSSTPCKILGVELLDKEGKISQTFEYNDTLRIRIHYKAFVPVNNPYFGITLWTDDGVRICTIDSRFFAKADFGILEGEGAVECIIPELPLVPGTYLVRVRIFDAKTGWPYDSLGWDDGNFLPFYIISKKQELIVNRYHGIVDIPAVWNKVNSKMVK